MINIYMIEGINLKDKIFIDTSAFFAIMVESDKNHKIALEIFNKVSLNYSPCTGEPVLSETFTLLKRKFGIYAAVEFGNIILLSTHLNIFYIEGDLFSRSWEIFTKYKDQDFSFVDCLSFAILKKENISKVFSFDKHFNYMGYNVSF